MCMVWMVSVYKNRYFDGKLKLLLLLKILPFLSSKAPFFAKEKPHRKKVNDYMN